MRYFEVKDVREAVRWAASGGQALHTHPFIFGKAPTPFIRAGERGELIAHLFDWDSVRLARTARAFGVRRVYIHHPRTARQHIDLCSGPLRVAAACCESPDDGEKAWHYSQGKLWIALHMARPRQVNTEDDPLMRYWKPWKVPKVRRNPAHGFAWFSERAAEAGINTEPQYPATRCVLPEPVFNGLLSAVVDHKHDFQTYIGTVLIRLRPYAMQALRQAFAYVDDAALAAIGGEWSEDGVQARFGAMTPDAFAVRYSRTFHEQPTERDIRLAFGSTERATT